MLSITVQNLGDISILHCRGRILGGDSSLLTTAMAQNSSSAMVLDVAQVEGIDAGGLGVLLELRAWAHSNEIQLKLMNVMRAVQQVLESTRLNVVFDTCSVQEMFHLLCRANGVNSLLNRRTDQGNTLNRKLSGSDGVQRPGN